MVDGGNLLVATGSPQKFNGVTYLLVGCPGYRTCDALVSRCMLRCMRRCMPGCKRGCMRWCGSLHACRLDVCVVRVKSRMSDGGCWTTMGSYHEAPGQSRGLAKQVIRLDIEHRSEEVQYREASTMYKRHQ